MDLKLEHLESICRICLSEKETMKDIFNFADILLSCTPIQIEQGDGLPSAICTECINQMNQAYEFRLLCEQSDNILRKKLIKQHIVAIKTDRYENESSDTCRDNTSSPEINLEEKRSVPLINNEINTSLTNDLKTSNRRIRHRKSKQVSIENESINYDQKENIKNEQEEQFNILESDENDDEESNKELSCRYCDMKFRYKISLKKHEQKHLTGLKCHLCEKDFLTIKQLKNHVNIHSRKGAHLCQTCGKQFTLPENLVRHQRIHSGVKPYKCQLCNKSFTQSNELKSHLITHSAEKRHLCSVCGNKYSRSISLKVHMRRIHSIPPNHRPYICAVCGRNFKDRRDLSQHMSIHTGERSHICGVCGKAFNRSSNLRVHERIHSGHKPHVCPVCQRAFIQKHVLITHMRTHPHTQTSQQDVL